jgi:outer membrane protein assembly factor BamB
MEIARTPSAAPPPPVPPSAAPPPVAGPVDSFDLSQAARILHGTELTPDGHAVMLWNVDTDHYRPRAFPVPGGLVEAGMDGTVRSLTPDGQVAWARKLSPSGEPAVSRDGLIFASSRKGVTAYDESGTELWTRAPSTLLTSFPAAGPEGHCYVASTNRLFCLDGRTGEQLWKFDDGPAWEDVPPLIGPDGTVYYCSGDDVLHAIDPRDGSEKWRFSAFEKKRRPLFSDFTTRLALASDGGVCFGAADGRLHKVVEGNEAWARELPSVPRRGSSVEVDRNGAVYAGVGESVVSFAADGTPRWRQDVGPVTEMAALDEGVAVSVQGVGVEGLDGAGNRAWLFPSEGDSRPIPGDHGEIFVGSDRTLYAVQPVSRFTAAAPKSEAGTIESHDGWVLIGGVKVPVRS